MSHALLLFCFKDELLYATAVELSVLTGMVDCLCPNASKIVFIVIPILQLWNIAAVSASAADDTTWRRRWHSTWTGALIVGDDGGTSCGIFFSKQLQYLPSVEAWTIILCFSSFFLQPSSLLT